MREFLKQLLRNKKLIFFSVNSAFSSEHIQNVERLIRTQCKSPLRVYCRRGRIITSAFGRVLRSAGKGRKNLIDNIIRLKSFSYSTTEFGQTAEGYAKIQLKELLEEKHIHFEILPTGFLIDEEYGFLGATPDSLVTCDCHDVALLEIKSSYKGRYLQITDIEKKYLFLDENLNLKRDHVYFDQIQGQMDIWKTSKCYSVAYTDVDRYYQLVDFDEKF